MGSLGLRLLPQTTDILHVDRRVGSGVPTLDRGNGVLPLSFYTKPGGTINICPGFRQISTTESNSREIFSHIPQIVLSSNGTLVANTFSSGGRSFQSFLP